MTNQMAYRPHPDVIATTLSDQEVVLLHLQTHHYYTLNATGAQIWALLDRESSLAAISEALTATYELPIEDAYKYVLELVQALAAEQLVQQLQPVGAA